MKKIIFITSALLVSLTYACKKPKPPTATDPNTDPGNGDKVTGIVSFEFNNKIGNEDLVLEGNAVGSPYYINANGDSFTVSKLKYYVSNFKLKGSGVADYVIPESYFLVDESKDANTINFENVPAGTYTSLEIMIGVDSARNMSGAQSGYLDPMLGMFWDWNTGYIMAMIEGESPSIPAANKSLAIHVGGFMGEYNTTKSIKFDFSQALQIKQSKSSKVAINADILKWFEAPTKIDFSTFFLVSAVGQEAKTVADNYRYMFTSNSVTNP